MITYCRAVMGTFEKADCPGKYLFYKLNTGYASPELNKNLILFNLKCAWKSPAPFFYKFNKL